jgi:hypothetical protein
MRFKQVGNKRDEIILTVRNADTVALLPGQAAILNFPFASVASTNGISNAGLDIVGYNNAQTNFSAQTGYALLYGVVVSPPNNNGIPVNGFGEVQAFGYCPNVQLTLATRASTNSIWPSYAAINGSAGMIQLYPESLANGFTTNAIQSFASLSTAASPSALTQFVPAILLGGSSIASATTQASSLAGYTAATALTLSVTAFLRIL